MGRSAIFLAVFASLLSSILFPTRTFAGPPFLTDDPAPVDYHHWEGYIFAAGTQADGTTMSSGPAIEVNNGIAPNTQLHLVVPYATTSQSGTSASGLGDAELGLKYRLADERSNRPMIGVFPLLELPTGDRSKGLGNGRPWVKVPVWLQKSWGAWTSYGGVGYAYNPAPGMRSYSYGGLLLQRTLTSRLTLGVELFLQGAQVDAPAGTPVPSIAGARWSSIVNAGGIYNFTADFSLLFSAGHSIAGDGTAVYYLALYRTWGPGAP